MVLCFIALPILLILGIFSVKYRILAKDALECIGRTVTFRKCKSQLDERIKSHLTGKIIKIFPKFGMFVYRRFQAISTIFIILTLLSLFFSATGFANYIKYGNCNGPVDNSAFCIYSDVLGTSDNGSCKTPESCTNDDCNCDKVGECICNDGTCNNIT